MIVKIIGAGSIGCHMAHAARSLGWTVDLVDCSGEALSRARNQTFPTRYGQWDDSINLFLSGEAPTDHYDLIILGTPPDTHMQLALSAVKEKPKALLIEKPACTIDLDGVDRVIQACTDFDVVGFVGYNHCVSDSVVAFEGHLRNFQDQELKSLDVHWREHWAGIFSAHPWLSGPFDSYLGFYARGGGAACEHSHGINMWQHFSRVCGGGRIKKVQATFAFDLEDLYDEQAYFLFETETGLIGSCIQDVVTHDVDKSIRLQLAETRMGLKFGSEDSLFIRGAAPPLEERFRKTRPDDFIAELLHVEKCLTQNLESPISLRNGLETMVVLAACFESAETGRSVEVKYEPVLGVPALTQEN